VAKKKITSRKIVLAICSILIVGIGFGFLPEILGEEVKTKLQEVLGENYYPIILGFFGFVIIVWLIVFFNENEVEEEEIKEAKNKEDLRTEFLKNLRQLYEKRLHDKMLGEMNFEIKLNLKYTSQGTHPETVEDFFIIKNEIQAGDFDRFFKKYITRL